VYLCKVWLFDNFCIGPIGKDRGVSRVERGAGNRCCCCCSEGYQTEKRSRELMEFHFKDQVKATELANGQAKLSNKNINVGIDF